MFFYNIKNIVTNYCNLLFFLLKTFKNYFIYYSIRTLPINSLVINTQIASMYSKKSFDNIYLRNILNKDYVLQDFKLNSINSLFYLYNDFFVFINKKHNLKSFNNLILNLKLNYFLLLINAN